MSKSSLTPVYCRAQVRLYGRPTLGLQSAPFVCDMDAIMCRRSVLSGFTRRCNRWIPSILNRTMHPACNRGPACINASELQQTDDRQHVRPWCSDIRPPDNRFPKEARRTTAPRTCSPIGQVLPNKRPLYVCDTQLCKNKSYEQWLYSPENALFLFIMNIIQKHTYKFTKWRWWVKIHMKINQLRSLQHSQTL